jgi:hypothetical protein
MMTVFMGCVVACSFQAILKGSGKQPQLQLQVVKRVLLAGKLHSHKKQAGIVVVVLGGFFNVAAMLQQKARHGMHDAGAVWAGEGEDVGGGHGCRAHRPRIVAAWPSGP